MPKKKSMMEEDKAKLINSLSRIEGHIRSIKKMIMNNEKTDNILVQVLAIKASLDRFAYDIIDREMNKGKSMRTIKRYLKLLFKRL